jgi:thiol-disulfide isomerase/thioredoxin
VIRFLPVLLAVGCAPAAGDADLERRVSTLERELVELRERVRSKQEIAEESVVGKEAKFVFAEWLQGQASPESSKATLLVFWEVWCPHCKREVPALQKTYTDYRDDGLAVIGITRLTRNTTVDQLHAFLAENGVTYPIARDDGVMGEHYAVSGVPAAALVKDGKVVWRGNPQRLNSSMIEAALR